MSGSNSAEFLKDALKEVRFDEKGLITAVAIDVSDGAVLMLAHMNAEALRLTLETGRMTYWSRSRKKLWVKGETSGNTQRVVSVNLDCDGDALVFKVEQEGAGAACHEGYRSCFFRKLENGQWIPQGSPISPPV